MKLKPFILVNLLILESLCKVICLLQTLLLSSLWSFSSLRQPRRMQPFVCDRLQMLQQPVLPKPDS